MADDDRKPPYILSAQDPSSGRPATFIFLHGYGDDAEGLPLGLAQQFQWYNKLPHLKWLLPNAPFSRESMSRAWYQPRALGNGGKPPVPGRDDAEDEDEVEEGMSTKDDEKGILWACAEVDRLVEGEIEAGTPKERIVVGGFSQGCAIGLVWGLVGEQRNNVAGVVCLSGYFPLAERIEKLREDRKIEEVEKGEKKWFYIHGSKDMLVPTSLFTKGKETLEEWIDKKDLEEHLYEGLGHSTNNKLLRDLLGFLTKVVPP
jgi:predicted esterase